MFRHTLITLLCTMLIVGQFPETAFSADNGTKNLTLPAGTPLKLVMLERLYSQRNRAGDEIIFALEEDVVIMGRTYLVKCTPVLGRVTHNKPARSWGRGGNLDIEITSLHPIYSMPIKLTGESADSGGSDTVKSVATSVLLGISVVGLLAGGSISGKGAIIEEGTSIAVFSADEGEIMDISQDEMRAMVDEWYIKRVKSTFLNYSWDKNPSIRETMKNMGYNVDESSLSVEPIENNYYRVTVDLGERIVAFTFHPWEEPHIGKFRTIKGEDELAKKIITEAD